MDIVSFTFKVLLLPLILIWQHIDPKSTLSPLKRILGLTLTCLFLIPIWAAAYGTVGYAILFRAGYIEENINISGTGSMYPTFPKGLGKDSKSLSKQVVSTPGMFRYPNGFFIFGKRYFNHVIGRGDIVVAENNKIRDITKQLYEKSSGLVKRVIAIPGDTIEIRDGIVMINSVPQKEPYVARGRSTFGGRSLPDCQTLTIPPHKYFLMGDNRKGSGDSRQDIGLVDDADIEYVIPYDKQKNSLDRAWHDATNDLAQESKISLDKTAFVRLLNEKRSMVGVKALTLVPKLTVSAQKRGEVILKYDDFSFEATRSGYSMTRATSDAGYTNIVYGESAIVGYYEADELIENLFESAGSKKFLTNKDFGDVGVSEVQGLLNNCPSQVVILHFAGYVPPNYAKDVIESWVKALTDLKDVQPGWAKLKTYPQFYQRHSAEVDRLNDLITARITAITPIVESMKANTWLTKDEETAITADKAMQEEMNTLAQKLNSYKD